MGSEHNSENFQQLTELEKEVRFNKVTVGFFAVIASLNVLDYGIDPIRGGLHFADLYSTNGSCVTAEKRAINHEKRRNYIPGRYPMLWTEVNQRWDR